MRTLEHPARVVVIDDCMDLRDMLRFALLRGGLDVVGEAGDGRDGIEVVREQRPDAVLLDLSMPVMDGLEALPHIRETVPDARIVIFSGFDAARRDEVLASGADGHLVKGAALREIVDYLKFVLAVPKADASGSSSSRGRRQSPTCHRVESAAPPELRRARISIAGS
jgi:DNA-binding NarL/FixJ family response regulator